MGLISHDVRVYHKSNPGRGGAVNPSMARGPDSFINPIDRFESARTQVIGREQGRLHRVPIRGGRCHGFGRAGGAGVGLNNACVSLARRISGRTPFDTSIRARDSGSVGSIGARASACKDG